MENKAVDGIENLKYSARWARYQAHVTEKK